MGARRGLVASSHRDPIGALLQARSLVCRWFFQQLIVGVDYLHRMGVASRDIKLENTLLDGSPRPLVKICDFGYSKHEKFQSAPGSRVGTPAYLAPEVIMTTKGQTYDGKVRTVCLMPTYCVHGGLCNGGYVMHQH